MLTRTELGNIIYKLPSNDAYGELIKDVANVYDLMEEAMDDETRDIKGDKISITMAGRTVDIPLYMAATVNSLQSMLEEIVREAVPNIAFETAETINEELRCDAERILVDHIYRNHEVMGDEEFQDAFRVTRNIHQSRLLEAIAADDEFAISFYKLYDNRYDYLHNTAERGMLYEYFLKADDINKWPTPTKWPVSILDIEPVERAFYIGYIDDYLKGFDYNDASRDYNERIAIESYVDDQQQM
jgi:hypothetical protein